MKIKILLLVSLSIVCAVAMWILYAFTLFNNHHRNDFVRLTPLNVIGVPYEMDLGYNSYYFAGATPTRFYLGNYTAPTHVVSSNYLLTDTLHLSIRVDNEDSIAWRALTLAIDSPYVSLSEYLTPAILHGKLSEVLTSYLLPIKSVNAITAVSSTQFVMRIFDADLQKNIIADIDLETETIREESGILEKQVDGLFCTDGQLHYDPSSHLLTYVYYYRNTYLIVDTDLQLLSQGHTIDTVSQARMQVAPIRSNSTFTFSAPPLMINPNSSVSNGLLFVQSTLLARNEEATSLNKRSVIDVYSLDNTQYQFSFYVPHYEGKAMRAFKVIDGHLLVLVDQYLLSYTINFNAIRP